jgi:hypothetical protein
MIFADMGNTLGPHSMKAYGDWYTQMRYAPGYCYARLMNSVVVIVTCWKINSERAFIEALL